MELKQKNMDFNIAYQGSLDDELFTVHLMFEETVNDPVLLACGVFGRSNFTLPAYLCPTDQGDIAFERGLEQVNWFKTSLHFVWLTSHV